MDKGKGGKLHLCWFYTFSVLLFGYLSLPARRLFMARKWQQSLRGPSKCSLLSPNSKRKQLPFSSVILPPPPPSHRTQLWRSRHFAAVWHVNNEKVKVRQGWMWKFAENQLKVNFQEKSTLRISFLLTPAFYHSHSAWEGKTPTHRNNYRRLFSIMISYQSNSL